MGYDMFFELFWILVTLFVVVAICYLHKNKEDSFSILTALYCTMAVAAAVAATKMISLFNFSVPGGVIIYAASFLITDLISEVHGKKAAVKTVYSGFISMLIFAGYSLLMVYWKPAPFYTDQAAFETVVGLSFRITMASWISFMVSQYCDVVVFHRLKESKKSFISKHLWIRNCSATIASQFVDSVLFISIAFYGLYDIWPLIISQYFVKVIIALFDTPFVYWGRHVLNRKKTLSEMNQIV
jgi:hypothetical protein